MLFVNVVVGCPPLTTSHRRQFTYYTSVRATPWQPARDECFPQLAKSYMKYRWSEMSDLNLGRGPGGLGPAQGRLSPTFVSKTPAFAFPCVVADPV